MRRLILDFAMTIALCFGAGGTVGGAMAQPALQSAAPIATSATVGHEARVPYG